MATLQDLDRRIKSVKNTRKITKAMEMVAAAKLRRAQLRIETLRPFADALIELTVLVTRGMQAPSDHALLAERDVENICIVMFTGDRGLAGALNANVLRQSLQLSKEWSSTGANVRWIGVGKKGVSSLQFRNLEVDHAYRGITDSPKYRDAEDIATSLIHAFRESTYDKVVLVYNHFESAMTQRVIVQDLLPMTDELLVQAVSGFAEQPDDEGTPAGAADSDRTSKYRPDWIFEPDSAALLDRLLPTYVEQATYRALLESTASEHGSRMTAMRNASENAGEVIEKITLQRNRARQAAITQEILEIVAGADAL